MSANNQTLIKEHNGKFYVFENIMAESWQDEIGEQVNILPISSAVEVFDNRDDAYAFALRLDEQDPSEYGVQFNRLCKDDSEVNLQ